MCVCVCVCVCVSVSLCVCVSVQVEEEGRRKMAEAASQAEKNAAEVGVKQGSGTEIFFMHPSSGGACALDGAD